MVTTYGRSMFLLSHDSTMYQHMERLMYHASVVAHVEPSRMNSNTCVPRWWKLHQESIVRTWSREGRNSGGARGVWLAPCFGSGRAVFPLWLFRGASFEYSIDDGDEVDQYGFNRTKISCPVSSNCRRLDEHPQNVRMRPVALEIVVE